VSIARDQGEGRYVLIRGTEPRLNSVLIDGERIPAPESETRQVQLDAVPAPERSGDSPLPGQSSHLGNVAVWYEKAGFSARAAWNFHGKYIDAVGASAAGDVFYDNHTQLDLSFGQRLARNFRLYTDLLNLTNAPLRYYEGTWDRPIQEEYYRWWLLFGVKANF
jgi:outer membrane receptor protein involved in Fe transport